MSNIIQRGLDSSGRPVRATARMWAVWDQVCRVLGFEPTIVQGGWQGSGGADASANTHDGDAFDIRLWDRTDLERAKMIRVYRSHALAYWERYPAQGFDLHAHMAPGPWASPSAAALDQWDDYKAGRNGLASHLRDYHWRPTPLVTTPPQEDDMFEKEDRDRLTRIETQLAALATAEQERAATLRKAVRQQAEALRAKLRAETVILEDVEADVDRLIELAEDKP